MILALVQARMNSRRLPGKMLLDVEGSTLLQRVLDRALRCRRVDAVWVATTSEPEDDPLAALCPVPCYRGSALDVLDRFYQAARQAECRAVVRLTGDCPLLEPSVVDRLVERFEQGDCDYVSNVLHQSFPDGCDAEVFSFTALERAWREASRASEREHVTSYLYGSGQFRTVNLSHSENLSHHRWTVDEPADLEFVRRVYRRFAPRTDFSLEEILRELDLEHTGVVNAGYLRSLYLEAEAGAAPPLSLERSRAWLERAEKAIPGCAQTFSKGPDQHVRGVAPAFLQRGQGCRVWDVDGNEYIDYVQGLLPNILGYAHPEVNRAVMAQIEQGTSFSLPHPLEVELAERLIELIPCAERVRFAKNGSDVTSAAVRLARAATGRERVACCGYHGWHDWYIGSTTRHLGVPEGVRALTTSFPYNQPGELEQLLSTREFAAVLMEPVNFTEPAPGYLEAVRGLCDRYGTVLVFDEVCSGFHFGLGGAQQLFGVTPDLACFGKAMGNGFPIACLVGRAELMDLNREIFFSGTFGGEAASLAAALKVLELLESTDALARMQSVGRRLQEGFNGLAAEAGLHERFQCLGRPTWALLKCAGFLERSLFQQETVKRGLLILVSHNLSAAHDKVALERTLEVYAGVFKTLAGWLGESDPARFLEGPMVEPVFRVRA